MPTPHKRIQRLYEEATPYVLQLQENPGSQTAVQAIEDINGRTKKLNENDEIEPIDQWTIAHQSLVDVYQKTEPFKKRLEQHPSDTEAKTKLEECNKSLADITQQRKYADWKISIDKSASTGSATLRSPQTTPTAATSQTVPTSSIPKASPNSTSVPDNRPNAVKQLQAEILKYCATTSRAAHRMANGDTILSFKALSGMSGEPYGYELVVMTAESPYFQVQTGSDVGQDEVNAYIASKGAYQVKTDLGDKDTPVYTFRDNKRYSRLLWTAAKPRKQTLAGRKPRTGNTQCGVLWNDGTTSVMARSHR